MREIKFRGKRLDNKKWIYGNLNIEYDGAYRIGVWVSELVEEETNLWEPVHYLHEVDPETVGQYIGLNDNTRTENFPFGKEIYEGDIVNHRYGKEQVKFADGCFYPFTAGAANSPLASKSEVVGNKHENPDLN